MDAPSAEEIATQSSTGIPQEEFGDTDWQDLGHVNHQFSSLSIDSTRPVHNTGTTRTSNIGLWGPIVPANLSGTSVPANTFGQGTIRPTSGRVGSGVGTVFTRNEWFEDPTLSSGSDNSWAFMQGSSLDGALELTPTNFGDSIMSSTMSNAGSLFQR